MKTLKPCGTVAAYKRHLASGQRPCSGCTDANREHDRSRYYGDPGYRRRVNERSTRNARRRAGPPARRPTRTATCAFCERIFETGIPTQVYCDAQCRSRAKWKREVSRGPSARSLITVWVDRCGRDGRLVNAEARPLPGGGEFIWCPSCGTLAGIADLAAYQARGERSCAVCDLRLIPAR